MYNKVEYNTNYNKENYDRCIFNVPKGRKAAIKAHYERKGYKSLNSYVNALIAADMAGGGKRMFDFLSKIFARGACPPLRTPVLS